MSGYVTGGWGFVIAAYSFTATVLFGYLASVVLRLRAEARAQEVADEANRVEMEVPAASHAQVTP